MILFNLSTLEILRFVFNPTIKLFQWTAAKESMRVLITGATGFLGNNLVLRLIEQGHQVTAAVRLSSDLRPLAGMACDTVPLNLSDLSEIQRSLEGIDVVIHAAAKIHLGLSEQESSFSANVKSTDALAQAARWKKIRMIYVSTVDTLAAASPLSTNCENDIDPQKSEAAYVVSKRAAEQHFLSQVELGLDGVIVNPGFMIGPRDWKPSSGRMMISLWKQPILFFAPGGGCSAVDVRDVATGIVNAIDRAETGQRYILAGTNLSYLELWRLMANIMGKRPPVRAMRNTLANCVGMVGDGFGRIIGRETELNSISLKMGQMYHWYSSQKAIDHLDYQISDLEVAIQDAWNWFNQHNYV